MKRDFSTILIGIGGQKILDGDQQPLTLGVAAVTALVASYPDEPNLTGEGKFKRWLLAERLANGGVIEVSAEEVTLIKQLIGRGYPPLVVGPAYLALEKDCPTIFNEIGQPD